MIWIAAAVVAGALVVALEVRAARSDIVRTIRELHAVVVIMSDERDNNRWQTEKWAEGNLDRTEMLLAEIRDASSPASVDVGA